MTKYIISIMATSMSFIVVSILLFTSISATSTNIIKGVPISTSLSQSLQLEDVDVQELEVEQVQEEKKEEPVSQKTQITDLSSKTYSSLTVRRSSGSSSGSSNSNNQNSGSTQNNQNSNQVVNVVSNGGGIPPPPPLPSI